MSVSHTYCESLCDLPFVVSYIGKHQIEGANYFLKQLSYFFNDHFTVVATRSLFDSNDTNHSSFHKTFDLLDVTPMIYD